MPFGSEILHPVFAKVDEFSRVFVAQQAGNRGAAPGADGKHVVDAEMVVKGDDRHRQVFAKRLEVDGEIGRQGGLADSPFFAGNGDNKRSAWFHTASPMLDLIVSIFHKGLSSPNVFIGDPGFRSVRSWIPDQNRFGNDTFLVSCGRLALIRMLYASVCRPSQRSKRLFTSSLSSACRAEISRQRPASW